MDINNNTQPTNFDKLHKVFTNVNDWLKFAETKNGTLIAFNTASIFGLLKFIPTDFKLNFWTSYAILVLSLLVFSTLISLLSFVPKLKIVKPGFLADKDSKNVLFFEYLKGLKDKEAYDQITSDKYESGSQIEKDIANQIVQNSIVASRKYSHFGLAIWFTISAYITPLPAGIFWLYEKIKE